MKNKYLILITFIILFSYNVFADDYQMNNVEIQETGDPSLARNKAISAGERSSLAKLLEKLFSDSAFVAKLRDDEISAMVKDFEFISEKMTATNYKAVVNFTFDKIAVDKLVKNNSYTTDSSAILQDKATTLIIPIFIRGKQTIVWEDYNYWAQAIDREISKLALVEKFVLPIGELDDVELLSDQIMASGNYKDLYPIMKKYHASDIIIAISHYFINEKTSYPTIILSLRYVNKNNQKTFKKDYIFKEGGSLHELLEKTSKDLLSLKFNEIKPEETKPVNSLNNDQVLETIVNINNIDDWLYIKQKLIDLCGEKNILVRELSKNQVKLKINHSNVLGDVLMLLNNANIKAYKDKSANLILSR